MKLTSSSFHHQDYIPVQYTGDGEDISPHFHWIDTPPGTQSFAFVCDDPDAPGGTWDHWILYNIPPHMDHLEEKGENLPTEVLVGRNSWGKLEYGGPQPPSGVHHYRFTLYALDKILELKEGITKAELLQAMKGHILAETTLVGLYEARN